MALSLAGAAAHAQESSATHRAPREGEVVRDSKSRVLGRVDKVKADGSVLVIVGGRAVPLPATSLSFVDDKLVTSLSKGEALQQK